MTEFAAMLKFSADGLIPAVIQDAANGDVLMVGYMNVDALEQTVATGRVTYWSRSRQRYWVKGESSGHFQHVVDIRADCDLDALLIRVHQEGVACHEGYRSCFFRSLGEEGDLHVVESREVDPTEIYGVGGGH